MKTALIDIGGGYRAVYGTGIDDFCLKHGISFDHCYGVSAGSANLASFLAGQYQRSYKFYMEYSFRREYASWYNFRQTGDFINLDYIYSVLSNHDGEYPLDFDAFQSNPTDFTTVAADATTGKAHYFPKSRMRQDDYAICKASSAVPVVRAPGENPQSHISQRSPFHVVPRTHLQFRIDTGAYVGEVRASANPCPAQALRTRYAETHEGGDGDDVPSGIQRRASDRRLPFLKKIVCPKFPRFLFKNPANAHRRAVVCNVINDVHHSVINSIISLHKLPLRHTPPTGHRRLTATADSGK